MTTNLSNVNFDTPSTVTGLTSGKGNLPVGLASGLTERTVGTDGQVLIADSADASGLIWEDRFQYFMAYTTSNTNIVAGFTAIPWDVEQRKDSIYTHVAASPIVTIGSTGDYEIVADVTTNQTAGGRSDSTARIVKNGVELIGSRLVNYNRNSAQGKNSGSVTYVESCTAGDTIEVEAARLSGGGTIFAFADHCRITIRKI